MIPDPQAKLIEQAERWLALAENRTVGWGGTPSIPIGLVRELVSALKAGAAVSVLPDPQARLIEQPWFQNLTVGLRALVNEQASRATRAHLLAAIDEAERRLVAGEAVSTRSPEPPPKDRV